MECLDNRDRHSANIRGLEVNYCTHQRLESSPPHFLEDRGEGCAKVQINNILLLLSENETYGHGLVGIVPAAGRMSSMRALRRLRSVVQQVDV